MQLHEFEKQMGRLKLTYGEKNFPPERESMFWKRYERVVAKAFELAIDWVILSMPSPGAVVGVLDEKLKDAREFRKETYQEYKFNCEPCRDFGYGFIGDVVTRCTCKMGETQSDEDIKKHQGHYDVGRRIFAMAKTKGSNTGLVTRPLPYDPSERISG